MTDERHVVVLGGGVIGVASAWFLSRRGCRVTLVERREGVGLETSFANGGLVTPSMSDPWASPEIPGLMLKWLGREDAPFLLRVGALPGLVSWGLKFLRECSQESWHRNTRNILRLSTYSHERLRSLVRETGIDYESNPRGTLHLFRDALSMEKTSRTAGILAELGVRSRNLDPAGCVALEPALRHQVDRIAGGIHYPDDEAGDAHLFARRLAAICESDGVELRYGETVERIEAEGGKFSAVRTGAGTGGRRRLPGRPRQRERRPPAAPRNPSSHLPGQGLLRHVSGRRVERCARGALRGRRAQGRHRPARGSNPGRRDRGVRGPRSNPQPEAHRQSPELLPLPLSRLPRPVGGRCLDRTPPDDAGRHSLPRADARRGSLRQHRPWPPGGGPWPAGRRASWRTSSAATMRGSTSPA